MTVPVGSLSIEALMHVKDSMSLDQVIAVLSQPLPEDPSSNPTLQLRNLRFMHEEAFVNLGHRCSSSPLSEFGTEKVLNFDDADAAAHLLQCCLMSIVLE